MTVEAGSSMFSIVHRLIQVAMPAALLASASLLSGCSQELASFDDTYVPASVEEKFPIEVVEKPVKLTVKAAPGGLNSSDANTVVGFGREAFSRSTSPVTVTYSASSKHARLAANQAVAILARQGVSKDSILLIKGAGINGMVTLAFTTKVAQTKPCGAWPENLRPNQFNDSGSAFGCAVQQNIAAMVSKPEDFEGSRLMTPVRSSSQNPALDRYNNGTWTAPTADSNF